MPNSSLKHLFSVPPALVTPAPIRTTPGLGKTADFNVAAWLHLPHMEQQFVSLILRYTDDNSMQEIQVDHGKVNARNKILLSGIACLPVKKKIEHLEVYLKGELLPSNAQVEELFIQAVEQIRPGASQVQK